MATFKKFVDQDWETLEQLNFVFPIIYAHLNADEKSIRNGIYAARQEDKQAHNLCQFKLMADIKQHTEKYWLRLNRLEIAGNPAVNLSKVKYLHIQDNKNCIFAMTAGLDMYYSIGDQSWLEYRDFYTDVVKDYNGEFKSKAFRIYNVKKLEAEGLVYHCDFMQQTVFYKGQAIFNFDQSLMLDRFNPVRESLKRINTLKYDSKQSTMIYYDFEDASDFMAYKGTVRGLAKRIAKSEGKTINTISDRIRKRIHSPIIKPIGEINGKKVYASLEKINLQRELRKQNVFNENSQNRYNNAKKIKQWVKRNKGNLNISFPKSWTQEDIEFAKSLI